MTGLLKIIPSVTRFEEEETDTGEINLFPHSSLESIWLQRTFITNLLTGPPVLEESSQSLALIMHWSSLETSWGSQPQFGVKSKLKPRVQRSLIV